MDQWVLLKGGKRVRCTLHEAEFRKGGHCPHCTPGDAFAASESITPHESVTMRGYERRLLNLAADAMEDAEAARKDGDRANCVKFMDLARKATMDAAGIGIRFEEMERLSENIRMLKSISDGTRVPSSRDEISN